jgi:histone deacetylase 11
MPRIVYSRRYNIGFYGLERLHPFDSRKYGRAWRAIRSALGASAKKLLRSVDRPVSREELLLVHSPEYLDQLRDPAMVARVLELPVVSRLPGWLVDRHVLSPMRWATRGTILAAEAALQEGLVINLGGGFHHAKPGSGEGFCAYADAAIAIRSLRERKLLAETDRVIHIDTDAHQGNGVSHTFLGDNRVFLFDIFHGSIYPYGDVAAKGRIDCAIPVTSRCTESEYQGLLERHLPGFLDSVGRSKIGLAIYNAGTDVFAGDPLGRLNLSAAAILKRDLYVVGELRRRGLPTVMLLSGGYTRQSYRLVADSVVALCRDF